MSPEQHAEAVALGWDPRLLGADLPTGRRDCLWPLGLLLEMAAHRGERVKVGAITRERIEVVSASLRRRADGSTALVEGARTGFYNPDVPQAWTRRSA